MTSDASAPARQPVGRPLHAAFCGGGSGGHLTPGLAVAAALRQKDHRTRLQFCVSEREVDQRVLNAHSHLCSAAEMVVQPLRRSSPRAAFAVRLARAFVLCRRQFQSTEVDVVVGTGGFASLPGVLAAWWLGIPVVLLELNRIPGRATRRLARFCRVLLTGWPLTAAATRSLRCRVEPVGVPIAPRFSEAAGRPGPTPPPGSFRVLVLGGSQGASRLNELVVSMLQQWPADVRLEVLHQTGVHNGEHPSACDPSPVENTHAASGHLEYSRVAFLDDVPAALLATDLVICRCGAVTLAEVASAGRVAILVPMMSAADDHQSYNAAYLAEQRAALVIDERREDADAVLTEMMRRLVHSADERDELGGNLRQLAQPAAAERAAQTIIHVAYSGEKQRA